MDIQLVGGSDLNVKASFDPLDSWQAVFLPGHHPSVISFWKQSSKFCFILRLQYLWPLKPNSESLCLHWKPPVLFHKRLFHRTHLSKRLVGESCPKWKATKDSNWTPQNYLHVAVQLSWALGVKWILQEQTGSDLNPCTFAVYLTRMMAWTTHQPITSNPNTFTLFYLLFTTITIWWQLLQILAKHCVLTKTVNVSRGCNWRI